MTSEQTANATPRCDCFHDEGLHKRYIALVARVEWLEGRLREAQGAIQWMSASDDFAPDGKARAGFESMALPALMTDEARRALAGEAEEIVRARAERGEVKT